MQNEKTITLKPAKEEIKIRIDELSGEQYEELEITEEEKVITPPKIVISKQQIISEIEQIDAQIAQLEQRKLTKQALLNKFTQ